MALEYKFNISNKIQEKNENLNNDFLEEIENKDTSKEQELKYLKELERKFNLQERNEIELIKLEKRVKNIIIFDELQEQKQCKQLGNNPKETELTESLKQANIEKAQDDNYSKRLNEKESYKIDSVRPKSNNYRNESKRNRPNFQVYTPKPYKQRNFSENQQRTYSDGRVRSFRNHYNERFSLEKRYTFEQPTGFQKTESTYDKDEKLENHSYLLDLIPVTTDDEQKMLDEALELSKQQMFIERLQKKQLEKALQLDNEDKVSDLISEKKKLTQQNTISDELVSKEATSPHSNINNKLQRKFREHLNHNDSTNTGTSIQANYSKNSNYIHGNKYNNFTRNNNSALNNKLVQNNKEITNNPTKNTFRNLKNCDNTNISKLTSIECKTKITSLKSGANNIYEQNKDTSNKTQDLKYDEISSKNKFPKDSISSQDKLCKPFKFSKGNKICTAYQSTYSSKDTRESHLRNSKETDKNQTQESEENNSQIKNFDSNQKISTSEEIKKRYFFKK